MPVLIPWGPMEPVLGTRSVIDRLYRDGTVVARLDGTLHHLSPVAITGEECEALEGWVQSEEATHTIEIGLGYGLAALFACEGLLANGDLTPRHVVLDRNQATRFADCGLQVLDEAGVAQVVEFHAEASETALPRFLREGRRFDLGFIDANHRFDGVFLDLIYLGRLVCPGGIIFVDDYQLPSIRRAISFCTTNLGWQIEQASTEDDLHHWAVIRTSKAPRPRPFDHYVDF